MPDITQTPPGHWKYVSEGGATIVFSYVGPPDPSYDGMVLRLRKALNEGTSVTAANEEEPDDPIIEYQTRCMEKLFPRENLPRLRSVRLEKTWLERLAREHDVKRPGVRMGKDHIDFSRRRGVLATDLVGGNWIAVEIKPKWAFLPSTTHLSAETRVVKTQTCRFCMHSFMRNREAQGYVNNYCPLDLFSGNPGRVRKAIDCLWQAWEHSNGGVNNLKIFAGGKVVKPGEVERLVEGGISERTTVEGIQQTFKEALTNALLVSPVLAIISKLQRSLDVLDIEGLSKLWREAELRSPLYQAARASCPDQPFSNEHQLAIPRLGVSSVYLPAPQPSISDWVEFLDTFQSAEVAQMDHTQPKIESLRYYLLAYLLSATFKDCSIIAKLDFLKHEGQSGMHREYPVSVIDLDPKSLDRLQQWERLDREIVSSYTPATRKICIDDWVENK